jgi:hypothetical protein
VGFLIVINYLMFKWNNAQPPERYTESSIALLCSSSFAAMAATDTEQIFSETTCHHLSKASYNVRERLISPIPNLLAFSLALFIGMCVATIDPAGERSLNIEKSSGPEVCPLNCEMHKISLANASYNETTKSTHVTYAVSVGNSNCSLENWLIVLGRSRDPNDILSASPVPWEFFEAADQSDVNVIRFCTGIEILRVGYPAASIIYSFELAGNWSGKMATFNADIITCGGICPKGVNGSDCQKNVFHRGLKVQ